VNLQQFRFVQEAVRRGLNLTEVAKALHTSQPGVSKSILELEGELGIDIFERHGKRLRRVTEPGQHALRAIELILREVGNLKRIGEEFGRQQTGTLSIATTHTQARYVLPRAVATLRERHADVKVSLHQGTPAQVAQMVIDEVADLGLATEALADYADLVTLPCYEWQHVLVVPTSHTLATIERPTLEQIAAHALVTYHPAFAGRARIDTAFAHRALSPQVAIEAIDSDVIKTYVRLGLGVGIVAEMAVDAVNDADLVCTPVGYLFGRNVARLAFKRGAFLRQYVYTFAQLLSDRITPALLAQALRGGGELYEL
jgi:LysR family transcriptional regulator, cys regulon transcriptional activator